MDTVVFDESGNTGADLLNEDQPFFVLASTNLSQEEASELIKIVHRHQAKEIKFSKLKKSNSGKRRIIEFLNQLAPYQKRIKTTIFYKKFMVMTKIVDIIIEELARLDGIDLYKNGTNISLSNMHFYCMNSYCGQELTDKMYASFIKMIREQDKISIENFYYQTWQLYGASIDIKYQSSLSPILASERIIHNILNGTDSNSLDPAIPAFFEHCSTWGNFIGSNFDILHDTSKPIFQEKDTLELLMSRSIPEKEIGYDRRKFTLPLKVNGVSFKNSEHDSRIQITDLVAGCSALWAKGIINNSVDSFWNELNDVDLMQFSIGTLYPSIDVTPENLGTMEGNKDIHAVDYMVKQAGILRKKA